MSKFIQDGTLEATRILLLADRPMTIPEIQARMRGHVTNKTIYTLIDRLEVAGFKTTITKRYQNTYYYNEYRVEL